MGEYGHPFSYNSEELCVLDTGYYTVEEVVKSIILRKFI